MSFTAAAVFAAPAALPETGQRTNYAGGDDGALQMGVKPPSPRFTAGTGAEADCVIDNLTGLMWVKAPDSTTRAWSAALNYIANTINGGTGVCGHKDWRLPNVNELESLVNVGYNEVKCTATANCTSNADWLNNNTNNTQTPLGIFSNVQTDGYWSSTTLSSGTTGVWFVDMRLGFVSFGDKAGNIYVWPVRSVK